MDWASLMWACHDVSAQIMSMRIYLPCRMRFMRWQAFRRFDLDHSGAIDFREFKQAAHHASLGVG